MKFAVVILAFVAAVQAQFGQFNSRASAFSSFPNFNQRQPQAYNRQPQPLRQYNKPTFQQYKLNPPVTVTKPPPIVVSPTPTAYSPVPVVAKYYNDGRSANIVKYGNEINPDGSYSYFYETDNGIAAQAQGTPRDFGGNPPVVPDVAQGSFSWTSPEGVPIAISYIADENGYQPQGDAIPTPPPVPPQIARALEYIARNAPRK